MREPWRHFLRGNISSLIGAVIWLLFVTLAPRTAEGLLRTIENLLALAALVYLPLALALLYRFGDPVWGSDLLHFAQRFQPVAAICLLISFMLPTGPLALLFVLPWPAFALTMTITVLFWLNRKGWWGNYQLFFCAALLFLPIGAGWLTAYRLGLRPLNFPEVIVLLTAVHFHYTGFILPVIIGLVGRWLDEQNLHSPLYWPIALAAIFATPLIAGGITFSPVLEVIGVGLLFGAAIGLAAVLTQVVTPQLTSLAARVLLSVAALALVGAISLAMIYGLGEFFGKQWITIPQMVALHGWSNAIGFALCGLLGWRIIFPPSVSDGSTLLDQIW